MNKGNGGENGPSVPKIADRSREGDIFPATSSLNEYAEQARQQDDSDEKEAGDFVGD